MRLFARLATEYSRAHGLSVEGTRRRLSIVSFAGAPEAVRADERAVGSPGRQTGFLPFVAQRPGKGLM
jgi:hypothetical protein